uniref:E3 SUMO-protein ligase NSE2 n=1 Tax=Xenopsylla cheopis TaxID=163159 RepID=A0A6M2DHS1_XENCH
MEQNFDDILQKSLELLNTNSEVLLSNLPGENSNIRNEFSSLCEEYCKQDLLLEAQKMAFNTASLCADVETMEEVYGSTYKDAVSKLPSPIVHQKFIHFSEKLNENVYKRLDFGEDTSTSNENAALDPFTKKPISIPIKNNKCGHIYDKDSVMRILEINPKIRCPVVGCRVKTLFTVSNLSVGSVDQEQTVELE